MKIDNEKALELIVKKAIQILEKKHLELGMKATGDWINSLEAKSTNSKGYVLGYDYTKYLVEGRRSSNKIPPIKPLENWVQAKFGYSGKKARTVAFAVANKIQQEGTTWYKKGGSDLLEVLQEKNSVDVFNEIARTHLVKEVKLAFERNILELAV